MKPLRWKIIFEDDYIIVVDKPAGYLSIPDRYDETIPNMYTSLSAYRDEIFVNHRLDKDTSGIMLFTKSEEAHKRFSRMFENRKIDKHYFALVHNKPIEDVGLIELNLAQAKSKSKGMLIDHEGKQAISKYRIVKTWHQFSLVEVKLITGRMHQIRVHMKAINCPVICDTLYGNGEPFYLSSFKKKYRRNNNQEERPLLNRQALHAAQLHFEHAFTGEKVLLETEMPKDMRASINQMDKNLLF